MLVQVTMEHIVKGTRARSRDCPVWWALHEAFGGFEFFGVRICGVPKKCADGTVELEPTRAVVMLDDGETHQEFVDLPDAVLDFILRYDDGEEVEPIEFEFDMPLVLTQGVPQMQKLMAVVL